MFARVTTYELEVDRASESIDAFPPAIDRVRDLDGFVDASSSSNGTAATRSP